MKKFIVILMCVLPIAIVSYIFYHISRIAADMAIEVKSCDSYE